MNTFISQMGETEALRGAEPETEGSWVEAGSLWRPRREPRMSLGCLLPCPQDAEGHREKLGALLPCMGGRKGSPGHSVALWAAGRQQRHRPAGCRAAGRG